MASCLALVRVALFIGLAFELVHARHTLNFVDSTHNVVQNYKLAQALVRDRWNSTWSSTLPCARPKNHGHLVKTVTGIQSPTLQLRVAASEQFIFERIPIYTGCQVYISHKWKFIYIRQPKSSSTAVLHAIKTQMCGLSSVFEDCQSDELSFVEHVHDASAVWNEYFVFTFVRNPWIRLYSAYTMFRKHFLKQRTGPGGVEAGEACSTPFLDFSKNSNALRELCPQRDCCAWVATKHQFMPWFIDVHINDQSHCVFLPGGESLVDFVGATESITDDWPIVLQAINARTGADFQPAQVANPNGHGNKEQGGVESVCDDPAVVQLFNETTLFNIAHQYAMDVVRYGYL